MKKIEVIKLNEKEMDIISHSLGFRLDIAKKSKLKRDKKLPKEFYRNYYCAGTERHDNFPTLKNLEDSGLMERWTQYNQIYFQVTDEGIQVFKENFSRLIN